MASLSRIKNQRSELGKVEEEYQKMMVETQSKDSETQKTATKSLKSSDDDKL